MLNIVDMTRLINDISFELDLESFERTHGSKINITKVKSWMEEVESNYSKEIKEVGNTDLLDAWRELTVKIEAEDAKPVRALPKEELKALFKDFLAGDILPKMRRIGVKDYTFEDDDIIYQINKNNENSPNHKSCSTFGHNPYEMVYSIKGRAFIQGIIDKYKPDNLSELEALFTKYRYNTKIYDDSGAIQPYPVEA